MDSRYSGIELNDSANILAEETACDIYTRRLSAPNFVTYNNAANTAADIARKS